MRDIKFRAWSKKEKRMVYLAHNESSSTHLQINNHAWGIFEPDKDDYCGVASLNGGYGDVLMQYTGLTDKNGKEIYEGDICRITVNNYSDIELYVIKWDNDATARFALESKTFIIDFGNTYGQDIEVIGNIYENPELLESEVNND